ncbi:MAG: PQQ-like beta-propeller repeat protein [Desulfobacterales bacterium]|nr:PQQ-like beta-propeller repeat protein [Desulfobacterales bacterium]
MGHPSIGSDGLIYVCSGAFLFAFNPEGTVRWRFEGGDTLFSAPAIGADGAIVVGGFEDCLYGVESSSAGAADAPWPTFQRDFSHTANAGAAPAPGASEDSCLTLEDDLSLPVSCIAYGDASFRFTLTPFSMDPLPVWELDVNTLETGCGPCNGGCLSLEDDLSFDVPCVSYAGVRYRLGLIRYNQPTHLPGFYWQLAPDSLEAVE